MKDQPPHSEFMSRLLYTITDDEPYWVKGKPPEPELIAEACALAKDDIGFEEHRVGFETLAGILDVCIAEELESHGTGIAARNTDKHPGVVALAKSDSRQRAGVALAAAQGLAWYEGCDKWVQDHSLRNQIAKRVMTAILVTVGRVKDAYSPAELAALAHVVAKIRGMDLFVIRARGAILEILAANMASLPRDEATLKPLRESIQFAGEYPANPQPVIKAIEKLWLLAQP